MFTSLGIYSFNSSMYPKIFLEVASQSILGIMNYHGLKLMVEVEYRLTFKEEVCQ